MTTQKKESAVAVAAGSVPELGFEKDLKREEEGDWFSLDEVPGDWSALDGIVHKVKVRSRYTADYRHSEIDMQTKAMRKKEGRARIEFGLAEAERLAAKHCLVDWDITDANGKELPYSKSNAAELMTNRKYRDFQSFVAMAIAVLQGDLEEAKADAEEK